jgi:acyl-CoA-binding protein
MVESNDSDPLNLTENKIALSARLHDFYDNRDKYKVVKRAHQDTIIIKQAIEGDNMTLIVEMEIKDLVPADFLVFIHNWAGFTKQFNPYIKSLTPMTATGTKYQTYKTITKAPWPI